jgi:glycerol-3-phosphate acyltransferase PlsY
LKTISVPIFICFFSYLVGSIPFSYLVARVAAGVDLTKVGTGNIGAMNVRRATGSWLWFLVAMVLDALKGFLPVLLAAYLAFVFKVDQILLKGLALNFAVLGHNFSLVAYFLTGKFASGRGLATGGGGLLAYNYIYLFFALVIGLGFIFVTRYLLVGQLMAALLTPLIVYFLNPSDFGPILAVCILVLIRHLERVPSLLTGQEPKFYIEEKKKIKG